MKRQHNERNMAEDETDVLHGRNHNLSMKMSTLIKQESMVLLHTEDVMKTKDVYMFLISVGFLLAVFSCLF